VTSTSRPSLLRTYLEKRGVLLRYMAAACRDPGLAEDIVQDLYVKLSALETEPVVDNPSGYLFRMANNIYLNRLRALKSERMRDHAWQASRFETIAGDAVHDEPTPEARITGRQQFARLKAAIDGLPERTQAIFRLHKLDGLPQTQVAARLGISISSVEKHLAAALKTLAAQVRGEGGP
jgi:RNA polymerase sigma-70 factor (ECF subfamily)